MHPHLLDSHDLRAHGRTGRFLSTGVGRYGCRVAERDIDLLLLTGAGASYGLGISGSQIAAMKEWSDHLTRALLDTPGYLQITGLEYKLDGPEFETRLGNFLAAARAFRDGKPLMVASADLFYSSPTLNDFKRRENIAAWHEEVDGHLTDIYEIINKTLYQLFGRPSFDYQRAVRCYTDLLQRLAIAPRGGHWVYATTNYDRIGDEALEGAGYAIDWGERPRARGGDRLIVPYSLLDSVRTTVPLLHLHGRIGWYRRREKEGGEPFASDMSEHNPSYGTPIVMLPSPNKVYEGDEVIDAIWKTFEEALKRARRVLVLGHSLNDAQIVDAIAKFAAPGTVAVTVYGHASDPSLPASEDDPTLKIHRDKLPDSMLIPIRFGEENSAHAENLTEWVKRTP